MKKITLLGGMILSVLLAFGQQEVMVSRYMFNGLFLNPAYTGSNEYFRASLVHRNQWTGFDGAPKTSILAVDGPIKEKNMGLGLTLGHDRIGVTRQTDLYANYAYFLPMAKGKLSFGVRGGMSMFSSNVDQLVMWDNGDEVFLPENGKKLIPNFGFGTFYHTDRFFAGFSIPTMLAYEPGNSFSPDMHRNTFLRRHYLLNSGYVFDAGSSIKLKPSFLLKYLPEAPAQLDINLSAMFRETITAGISYRTGDAIIGMVEYQVTDKLRMGYAYDHTLSMIRTFSSGTHEVMLGYRFGIKDQKKFKNPRFF